jgi:hypothetical protein
MSRYEGKNPIFNYKVIIIVGVVIFAISFAVASIFPPIYGQLFGSILEPSEEVITDLDQSYHVAILTSNALLMEKIDWNNCAILWKNTLGYGDFGWSDELATDQKELKERCGEIP